MRERERGKKEEGRDGERVAWRVRSKVGEEQKKRKF